MKWYERENGISVLLACQNEEAIVGLCIRSLLEFGDELVIVDNGSTDGTKEIVRYYEAAYPGKVKFYDRPELPDLYQNRQFAFLHSSFRWVVRADADFVAYTDGPHDIMRFRKRLLSRRRGLLPKIYALRIANLTGDFWHTGLERKAGDLGPDDPGRYVPPPVSPSTLRVFEVFPGFEFRRLGRGEGVRYSRCLRYIRRPLADPVWMHCNIKSDRGYLFRSERTNWRELGDYATYPTLELYVQDAIVRKYGTSDIDQAAEMYVQDHLYPFLQPYDPGEHYPYPSLVQEQMRRNAIYRITRRDGVIKRTYYGPDPPIPGMGHP